MKTEKKIYVTNKIEITKLNTLIELGYTVILKDRELAMSPALAAPYGGGKPSTVKDPYSTIWKKS